VLKTTSSSYYFSRNKDFAFFNSEYFLLKAKVLLEKNAQDDSLFGFVISKKVGIAVIRNKIRRRLKSIMRLTLESLPKGFCYIFIVKPQITQISFQDIENEINKAFQKLHKRLTYEKLSVNS
jgi:ribonuclease P protein component